MLTQTLDITLEMYDFIRGKIDENLTIDNIEKIRSLWIPYKPYNNPYLRKKSIIAAVDSGYNYIEYRGYALYVVNTVWVKLDPRSGEVVDGFVDMDVVGIPNIEYELSLLSMAMEINAALNIINDVDILLMDGSLIAMFSKLRRASIEQGHELLETKKIDISRVLKELIYMVSLNPRKIIFISKNSSARDLLGFVKGDIYYFERYTDGIPGYSKPIDLAYSKHLSIATIARVFKNYSRNITGLSNSIGLSYIRFEPFSRIYRVEFVFEPHESLDDILRSLIEDISESTVQGYPYPLIRADQMARIGFEDIARVAALLGVIEDPRGREPL